MQLYKKEKVNPASGCLPILLQIPIFFSLYKVIFVTHRTAPRALDRLDPRPVRAGPVVDPQPLRPAALAAPEPGTLLATIFIGLLPILLGISMWLQQKLNPAPTDPTQAMIFAWMPWVFMFMLGRFASGLVLYWIANNTITFTQQYIIMRSHGLQAGRLRQHPLLVPPQGCGREEVTVRLAEIWRHPIKGIGRERLTEVDLAPGAPLPGDRAWAVLHEGGEETDSWQPRRNFLQAASGPSLMAVHAATSGETVTLSHPNRQDLTLRLPGEAERLLGWVRPLWPADRPAPRRLVAAPPQGMADNGIASLAILNQASLNALSEAQGQRLDMRRFRGNLDSRGRSRLGGMVIGREDACAWARPSWKSRERIGRCRATEADPLSGQRDTDPLHTLRRHWGHTRFRRLCSRAQRRNRNRRCRSDAPMTGPDPRRFIR